MRWGLSQVEHDLRAGQRFRNRNIPVNQIITVQGKHEPLWDDATLPTIQGELARRARNYRGRGNNQFTGLLKCSLCGATLWRQGNGPRGAHRLIWRFGDAQGRAKQLPLWMKEADPTQVNQFLHALIASITVHPDGEVDIQFK